MPIRHEGELAVQRRAGIGRDGIGSAGVGVRLPEAARDFLRDQTSLVVAARDDAGRVWASMLTGHPGFVHASGENTVTVSALPADDDPLHGVLDDAREIGAIAVEPATRRRMRINGRVTRHGSDLVIAADQAFANCPKYITPRPAPLSPTRASTVSPAGLTPDEQAVIARADVFFVGTHVPGLGADASHRGGPPGFVAVTGPRTLSWPDYRGNSMYLTLGNLDLDAACGLLFPDPEGGHPLRLTGRATIDWSPTRAASVPGAERMIDFVLT